MTIDDVTRPDVEAEVRERAIKRLKKRQEFHAHLLVYVLFNATLVVVWVMTGSHGFFWPVFLIAFWGIGVVMNAWDVYHRDLTEDRIQREMRKLSD